MRGKSFAMTNPIAGPGSGTLFSASVKWYDAVNGCGFLIPTDGSPDIFCPNPVLDGRADVSDDARQTD